MKFRDLYVNEIQVRPTDTKYKGKATLLLYQSARAAMDILDDAVGAEKWQKEYYEVAGKVYCRIGINCDGEWVWKSDCGMESNIDGDKGQASDAFKRAAVNWGIGRALYTAPRIVINCPDSYYYNEHLSMTFYVNHYMVRDGVITELQIVDKFNNVVFEWTANGGQKAVEPKIGKVFEKTNVELLKEFCGGLKGKEDKDKLLAFYTYYQPKCETWNGKFEPERLYAKWGCKPS